MNVFLESALTYIEYGWYVFPLRPHDKIPATGHGLKDASNNPEQIKRWWAKRPDANIGLSCEPSDLAIIDLDIKEEGLENWSELVSRLGSNDNTVTCLTGGGGQHIYYRMPEGVKIPSSIRKLGPGIDVKARGGYVILPPSLHPNGNRYNWEVNHHPDDCPILLLPPVLIELLTKEENTAAPMPGLNKIPEGRRNDHLARLAGLMRRKGMSRKGIEAALLAENDERCLPPLSEKEVKGIAASISRYPAEPPGDDFTNLEFTDLGNARRIEHLFGKDLRFCQILDTWFAWNGEQWRPDEINEVRTLAHEISSILIKEAAHMADKDKQVKVIRHALSSQSHSRITGMIEEAKALVPIVPQDLDKDLDLFNCRGGTINLNSGETREHLREDLITKLAPVTYDPDAKCSLWDKFLNDITLGNQELKSFLQRMVGYALTGHTLEQCVFILYGTGSNGKSTFVGTIRALLGDYSLQTPTETFRKKREPSIPSDLARLKGARLVVASETDQGQSLAESLIKQMTGGEAVNARELYGKWFEFVPTMKLWIVCNHKPLIRGSDNAIWRRIKLIPFNYVVPENLLDKGLAKKLLDELPGILNWALEGCRLWRLNGLGDPPEVTMATKFYREEMDLLGGFLAEKCDVGQDFRASASQLYSAYKDWCQENAEEPISGNLLGRILGERGFQKRKETTGDKRVIYNGIGLRPDDKANSHD